MYGLGLIKGLFVTLKNLVLPGRMFTVHQYPDRRIGVLGLAKLSGRNVFSYVADEPWNGRQGHGRTGNGTGPAGAVTQVPRRRVYVVRAAVHGVCELRQVLPAWDHPNRYGPER